MKHWSFLFSYLVAPKGAVCLFVCFSSKAMEFFFIIAFTEEFLPLFGSNPIVVDIAIEFLFYLRGNCRYSFVVRFFWRANGSDFSSRRAYSFCFPRPIRRPFSRAQATGTSCHDLHIWFSLMPNFRLAAELLELSDANLTTCNLKLAEYFIRFTFNNILLHVTQAKKTNREVRHLALPV